jgi:hypothetical protein
MQKALLLLIIFWIGPVFAIPCDCEVRALAPLTGSHKMSPVILKTYELEEFSSFAKASSKKCQSSCLREFQRDMTQDHLIGLLETYSSQLNEEKSIGVNCTGETTLKFPIKVKAKLGKKGLGLVTSFIQVIHFNQSCR